MKDLIIIGAGTAGLTAAIYGARAGLDVTVLEQQMYGGQIISSTSVENYPGMPGVSGVDFATALFNQAKELGVTVQYTNVSAADLGGPAKKLITDGGEMLARSVIIATGANPKKLGCPGEERLTGYGVSYCATCDGAFHRGRDVAVIGGGNTAIEDALILSSICSRVYLIHHSEHFRAEAHLLERLRARENVTWIDDAEILEMTGEGKLEAVQLRIGADGPPTRIPLSGVFVAIGSEPSNEIFAAQLSLDEGGYIIAGEDCATGIPGVFAAGDARTKKVRQIVTAAADGAVAAVGAGEYLTELA